MGRQCKERKVQLESVTIIEKREKTVLKTPQADKNQSSHRKFNSAYFVRLTLPGSFPVLPLKTISKISQGQYEAIPDHQKKFFYISKMSCKIMTISALLIIAKTWNY